jgi:uroporphyrinogen-III decarboxylase
MMGIADIDARQIEARKERFRRVWGYRKVDHIPVAFFLEGLAGRSLRELCEDGELQLEACRRNIDRLLRLLPDDYIPVARVWPGYMTIATMFGMEVHWSHDPNQAPGVVGKLIRDIDAARLLKAPDPRTSGLMPFNLLWLARFRDVFPVEVSLAGIDLGGPLNTAKDLFETDLLFTAMYDAPEEMERFLAFAARVQTAALEEIVRAAGSPDHMSSVDFDPLWAPEGRKGFVSDDVCAGLSAEHFRRFSVPYNNRILSRWPGGRIHNCGPHPAAALYLDHDPPLDGLNCSFRYTRRDLPRLKEAFGGRGIVELMFDNGETAEQIVRGYEEAAGVLAPDVAAIPVVWVNGADWQDDELRALYEELRKVAARYAGSMRWRQERP